MMLGPRALLPGLCCQGSSARALVVFSSAGFLASGNPVYGIPWTKATPFSSSRLVQLVREEMRLAQSLGQAPPVWGAKITGGGSGGTVCILGERRGGREGSRV